MADTLTTQSATPATIPASTVIATDDAGAAGHVQVVKLAISTDGSATALTADNTNGMLVNLGSNNDVTVTSGSVTADTELPTATALADNTANPTVPAVGAFGMVYDGSTWDRLPGTSADGALVNLGANNDVTVSGAVLTSIQAAVDAINTNTTNLQNAIVQDDAPFMPATGYLMMIGGEFDDSAPDSVNEGDAGNVRITANRSMHTTLRDAAGNERGVNVTAGNALTVDGSAVTQPISHAALTELAAAIDTEVQVDVVGALPAGTNAIGKLAANSGVDIGDVDVTSIIPGTGATNLGKAVDTATGATDTGVLALATRDDALSALTPIEGDNVQLRTDANGALWTHDDALDAALSGSELQVDVVAALPAGTNNIGDVDVLSIAAGDNNIGNVDIASIAAGDNNIGNVDVVTLPALAAGTNAVGKLLPPDVDVTTHTNYAKKYYTSTGAATDGIIWSPAAGKRWHVVSWSINVSAAATVTIEDDLAAGDSPVFKAEFAANSGIVQYFGEKYPLASGEDAADLLITTSAGNVYVTVTGYEV